MGEEKRIDQKQALDMKKKFMDKLESAHQREPQDEEAATALDEEAATALGNRMSRLEARVPLPGETLPLRREPFEMKFYHCVPVFRFYVIIKELETDDIEAIFRINSLSSFTLGVAQIIGITFHVAVLQQPLSIFHMINIVSQCLNWLITILYFFGNPAVMYMKGVIQVDAMRYNDRKLLMELQKKHAELMHKSAEGISRCGEPLAGGEPLAS